MFRPTWIHPSSWRWRTRYLWSQVQGSASCDALETEETGTHCCRARCSQRQAAGRTVIVFLHCGSAENIIFFKIFCVFSFLLSDVVAVASQDRMLSVFSSCGRRLLPAIQLATPVSALHCSAHFVMVLTSGATLSVWSVSSWSISVNYSLRLQVFDFAQQMIYLITDFQILIY